MRRVGNSERNAGSGKHLRQCGAEVRVGQLDRDGPVHIDDFTAEGEREVGLPGNLLHDSFDLRIGKQQGHFLGPEFRNRKQCEKEKQADKSGVGAFFLPDFRRL